jgi:hypothetical protein
MDILAYNENQRPMIRMIFHSLRESHVSQMICHTRSMCRILKTPLRFVCSITVSSSYKLNTVQKSTCARLNAANFQNKLKFKGCVVSGVVGITCARHSTFKRNGIVDLPLGER